MSRRRRFRGLPDQRRQPLARILAVAQLAAEARSRDDDHAIAGDPPAGELVKPLAHGLGQRGRAARIEPQLHGGRHLVDVLPARTRGAHERLLQLGIVDLDRGGHVQHGMAQGV